MVLDDPLHQIKFGHLDAISVDAPVRLKEGNRDGIPGN